MKNVHLLPTDKPSRLIFDKEEVRFLPLQDYPILMDNQDLVENQHIYITNSEEIKEGDWCIHPTTLNISKHHSKDNNLTQGWKKIILTTDQDLIVDGVQAIDDSFLEWFVKNPSCESIKVVHKFDEDWSEESGAFEISYYKIIIPKEEPKQYPIGGYAPGYYSCTCVTCKTEFMGDKLAVQCKPCAIEMVSVKIVENNGGCQIEEPKQIKCYCGHTTYCDCGPLEEPKQETVQKFIEQHGITEQQLIDGYKQGLQLIFENASKITK